MSSKKGCREIIIIGNLPQVVKELQEHHKRGERVFTVFNGHELYSDTVTMDSAYLEVTGKTKAEFDEFVKERSKTTPASIKIELYDCEVNLNMQELAIALQTSIKTCKGTENAKGKIVVKIPGFEYRVEIEE